MDKDTSAIKLREQADFFENEYNRLKTELILESNPTNRFQIQQNLEEALRQKDIAEKLLTIASGNKPLMTEEEIKSQEELPLLDKLRKEVEHAEMFLSKETPPPKPARLTVLRFRSSLCKIYGKDSPLLGDLSTIHPVPPRDGVHDFLRTYLPIMRNIVSSLESAILVAGRHEQGRVFLGHGRSPIWREFKDFLEGRLGLAWDEFNRESVAGYATSERLREMLDAASFAFLIMTAEEEHADNTISARPNVIHEVGLFQGSLGMHRAIILLEEGCSQFSNIVGLSQIRFPRDHISACFEEVRKVLERENLL